MHRAVVGLGLLFGSRFRQSKPCRTHFHEIAKTGATGKGEPKKSRGSREFYAQALIATMFLVVVHVQDSFLFMFSVNGTPVSSSILAIAFLASAIFAAWAISYSKSVMAFVITPKKSSLPTL